MRTAIAPAQDTSTGRAIRLVNQKVAICPTCGHTESRVWLSAPDRLHGRREEYTLMRCLNCSLVWLTNPPRFSEMHLHYTNAYQRLISAAGKNSPHRWQARKLAIAPYKQSGALLDLGCSSGAFLESLKGGPWRLYGIEISAKAAKTAEEKSCAKVFVGDVAEAPFTPSSFEVITCFDVLEHMYDPRQVMEKVSGWLKPGGIFYVLVPNIDSAEARVFGSYWPGLELPRHLSHFSPAALRHLAKSVGLHEVSLQTHRNPGVGTGLRYIWDDACGALGIRPTPVAYRGESGFAWRAGRKLVRITALRALVALAPLIGTGESIHAIFSKEQSK